MKDIVIIGDIMIDIVAIIQEEIHRGSDTQSNTTLQFGGAAANVATWLGINNISCRLIGALGDDIFGELFQRRFSKLPISTSLFVSERNTGSVIAISHPDKERSMLSELGANIDIGKAFSPEHISVDSIVYVSGYVLFQESNREFVNKVIASAKEKNATLVLDPASSAPLEKSSHNQMKQWLDEFDYILPNEDEFESLHNLGFVLDSVLFEKRGAEGVRIHARDQVVQVSAETVNVVDTVGAGDAFAAGVLRGLAQGFDNEESARSGIGFATRACQTRGATPQVLEIK